MRSERITEDEIRAAVRSCGYSDPSQVATVVLETDSSFSVVAEASKSPEALDAVEKGTSKKSPCGDDIHHHPTPAD